MPEPLAPEEIRIVMAARSFIKAHVPGFIDYVEQARQEAMPAAIMVDGFVYEATREQVQACLWYALGHDVPVTLRREKPLPAASLPAASLPAASLPRQAADTG